MDFGMLRCFCLFCSVLLVHGRCNLPASFGWVNNKTAKAHTETRRVQCYEIPSRLKSAGVRVIREGFCSYLKLKSACSRSY
jgi:hypothetical protein